MTLLYLFSTNCWANLHLEHVDLKYEAKFTKFLKFNYSINNILFKEFELSGFKSLLPPGVQAPDYMPVNQMGFNFSKKTTVIVVFGIEPINKKILNTKLNFKDGRIFHSNYYDIPFTLFSNAKKNDFENLIMAVKKSIKTGISLNSKNSNLFNKFFINYSHANTCNSNYAGNLENIQVSNIESLDSISHSVSKDLMVENGPTCLRSVWAELKDATVGTASRALDGIVGFFNNPLSAWNSLVVSSKNLYNFFADFPNKVAEAVDGVLNLTAEGLKAITCSFIGSLGPEVVKTIITGGVGAVGFALVFAKWIKRFSKFKKLIDIISKLPKSEKLGALQAKIILNLNNLSESAKVGINKLINSGLPKVATEAASCAM